jgi:hypothetical protein
VDPAPARGRDRPRGAVHIGRRASRQGADDRALDRQGDAADGLGVGLRGDREAGLQDVHAKCLELAGQTYFLVHAHREARGLFAVPEGRVENEESIGHATVLDSGV